MTVQDLENEFDPDATGLDPCFFGIDLTEEDEATDYHNEIEQTEASEIMCLSCGNYFVTDDNTIICSKCGSIDSMDVTSCEE